MRKLVVTENVTVDGVIDAEGDWFTPSGPDELQDMLEVENRLRASADALLVGRVTFEEFRSYWPHQLEEDRSGVARYLDNVQKYVVSGTLSDPEWKNSTVLARDMRQEVEALKQREGGDIVVTGSISLVHGLQEADLVGEYRLFVYPVVLGRGRLLFGDKTRRLALELVECHSFQSGVSLLRYRLRR